MCHVIGHTIRPRVQAATTNTSTRLCGLSLMNSVLVVPFRCSHFDLPGYPLYMTAMYCRSLCTTASLKNERVDSSAGFCGFWASLPCYACLCGSGMYLRFRQHVARVPHTTGCDHYPLLQSPKPDFDQLAAWSSSKCTCSCSAEKRAIQTSQLRFGPLRLLSAQSFQIGIAKLHDLAMGSSTSTSNVLRSHHV